MRFDDVVAMRRQLHGAAYSMTRNWDEAEDLVQSTMLRAWMARAAFHERHDGALKAWLKRIMHNVHVTPFYAPKSVRAVQMPTRWMHEPFPCAGEDACEMAEVERALNGLSAEHRQVLLMARAGFGYGEIAAKQGVALGTVKSRVSRAETAFRRACEAGA